MIKMDEIEEPDMKSHVPGMKAKLEELARMHPELELERLGAEVRLGSRTGGYSPYSTVMVTSHKALPPEARKAVVGALAEYFSVPVPQGTDETTPSWIRWRDKDGRVFDSDVPPQVKLNRRVAGALESNPENEIRKMKEALAALNSDNPQLHLDLRGVEPQVIPQTHKHIAFVAIMSHEELPQEIKKAVVGALATHFGVEVLQNADEMDPPWVKWTDKKGRLFPNQPVGGVIEAASSRIDGSVVLEMNLGSEQGRKR